MANRKVQFVEGEYYHIYNRGTDKRSITMSKEDSDRFVTSLDFFNSYEVRGSIRDNESPRSSTPGKRKGALVQIICFCLNPNHYHLLITPIVEDGVSKFMQRLGTGYTNYFNKTHERSGALFQSAFKARRITSDADLRKMSGYVNLNHTVHALSGEDLKLVRSSWNEYTKEAQGAHTVGLCEKDIVLSQFNSVRDYKIFAQAQAKEVQRERRVADKNEAAALKKEFYEKYFD